MVPGAEGEKICSVDTRSCGRKGGWAGGGLRLLEPCLELMLRHNVENHNSKGLWRGRHAHILIWYMSSQTALL